MFLFSAHSLLNRSLRIRQLIPFSFILFFILCIMVNVGMLYLFKSADVDNVFVVLQLLTSVVYELVSHSWTVAAITAKYYLGSTLILLYTDNNLSLEGFTDKLIEESRLVVSSFILGGTVLYVSGLELTPFFVLFSELTALIYLGVLFWKY